MWIYLLLAQVTEPETVAWWERLIDKYGFGGMVMLIGVFLLWKYAPRVIDNHVDYLKTTKQATEKIAQANETNARVNERLEVQMKAVGDAIGTKMDPKGDPRFDFHTFSTVQTNRAMKHLADALNEMAADHPARDRVAPHIKKAIEVLQRTRPS